MGHSCYVGDISRENPYLGCLHTTDHPGPPYTLVKRVERGFGLQFECANPSCGHTATNHVSEDGRATATGCFRCSCPGWVEPLDVGTGYRNLEERRDMGMGPEAPVVENENGAKQSAIPAVFTTMPLRALWELAKLQKYGDDKYGPHNWRGITEDDHVNHAVIHLLADRLGDISDEHLLHATWRMMAALEMRLTLQTSAEGEAF